MNADDAAILPRRGELYREHRQAAERAGNPTRTASIEELFAAKYQPLCRLAYTMLGDRGLAEQVVMDAFVDVHDRWNRLHDRTKAQAYLRRAVVNNANTLWRRRINEQRVNARASREESPVCAVAFDAGLLHQPIWRAVLALPPRQRAAVALYYYEDLSEKEIAQILRCTTGTIKSQLSKARVSLRQELDKEDDRG